MLAKPSGLLALAGLALATLVLRGRAGGPGLVGVGIGTLLALDAWHASRFDVPLTELLRAGNDDFWLERGAAARWEVLAAAGWVGDGARLLVLYGLAYAIARAAGAGARVGLAVGAGVALTWSLAGPLAAGEGLGYPFDGSLLGSVAWLAVGATMVAAPFFAGEDPLPRRAYAAILVWLARRSPSSGPRSGRTRRASSLPRGRRSHSWPQRRSRSRRSRSCAGESSSRSRRLLPSRSSR